MAGVGISAHDGQPLEGWLHVVQSIDKILTTLIETRAMRRGFGSEVPNLIDRPMTPRVMLALFAAVANALDQWEPRYDLTHVQVDVSAEGVVELTTLGTYYPRGHLGDFSKFEGDQIAVFRFIR